MTTTTETTTTKFHSEYEIVNWLASHDSFEQGVADLRSYLSDGRIANGHALVEKWLSVYDDVTAGRVVDSVPSESAESAPQAPAPRVAHVNGAAAAEEPFVPSWMADEPKLWGDTRNVATAPGAQRAETFESLARAAGRWGKAGVALSLLALAGVALFSYALWPQIEPRLQDLWVAFAN